MKKFSKNLKRTLTLLLCLAMITSTFAISSYADPPPVPGDFSKLHVIADASAVEDAHTENSSLENSSQINVQNGQYLFLPSSMKFSSVKFYFGEGAVATMTTPGHGSITVKSGVAADISSLYDSDTNSEKVAATLKDAASGTASSLVIMRGSNPSMHVTTTSGRLNVLYSSKTWRVPGSMCMLDSSGKEIYNGDLEYIKCRGNASNNGNKRPFNIKLDKKKALVSGAESSKTWTLLNCYQDATLIKQQISFSTFLALASAGAGMQYQNVDVYVDGVYRGMYMMVEKVGVNTGRVEITDQEEFTEWDSTTQYYDAGHTEWEYKDVETGTATEKTVAGLGNYRYWPGSSYNKKYTGDITGGYLLSVDPYAWRDELCYFNTGYGGNIAYTSPECPTEEQASYIAQRVKDYRDAMASQTGFNSKGKHYTEYVDLKSMAAYYDVLMLFTEWDHNTNNIYFYCDTETNGDKFKYGPLWDMDNSMQRDNTTLWTMNGGIWSGSFNKGDFWAACSEVNKTELIPFLSEYMGKVAGGTDTLDNLMNTTAASGYMDNVVTGRSWKGNADAIVSWMKNRYKYWAADGVKGVWDNSYLRGVTISNEGGTLKANVTGTASTYQWYRIKDANWTQADAVAGANAATYTPAGEGVYYVSVTGNGAGASGTMISNSIDFRGGYIKYDGNGNESGDAPEDGTKYNSGDNVTLANQGTLAKTGYTFKGWNTQADGKGVTYKAGDTYKLITTTTVYAIWEANPDTPYKVEHYKESDTTTPFKTENLAGQTDTTAKAVSVALAGYSLDKSFAGYKESGNIDADGSLVLKLYYKANTDTKYKVEHYKVKADGSKVLYQSVPMTGTTDTSVTAAAIAVQGYTYDAGSSEATGIIKGEGDLTLKLYYDANTNTAYTVNHYTVKADGSKVLYQSVPMTGTTDTSVTATPIAIIGYDFDMTSSTVTGNIEADGSLALNLYYKAGTKTGYTVEHYFSKNPGTAFKTENLTGTTDTTAKATSAAPAGYSLDKGFAGYKESGNIDADGSLVLKLYYKANTDTNYTVNHYTVKADGTKSLYQSVPKTGTTDESVTAEPIAIQGYTYNPADTDNKLTDTVKGDGSTVLSVYYSANTNTAYTVNHYTVKADGSKTLYQSVPMAGTTDTSVTATSISITGYGFDMASSEVTGNIKADGSLVLNLYYKPGTDTKYKVEHYYTKNPKTPFKTENLKGITDTTATAIPDPPIGYEEDTSYADRVASGNIDADGSLVLKLYYKARTDIEYKVEHYSESDISEPFKTESFEGTTDTEVTATPLTVEGFKYDSSYAGNILKGTVKADGSLVLKLYYKANNDTKYKVNHYKIEDDGSTSLYKTQNLLGVTGMNVDAKPVSIYGYKYKKDYLGAVPSGKIKADGSLELKLYYEKGSTIADTKGTVEVEYYTQDPSDITGNTYVKVNTDEYTGVTPGRFSVKPDTYYQGNTKLEFNSEKSITSEDVTAGNTVTLQVYYDLKLSYRVEYYLKNVSTDEYATGSEYTQNMTCSLGEIFEEDMLKEISGYVYNGSAAGATALPVTITEGTTIKCYFDSAKFGRYTIKYVEHDAAGVYVKDIAAPSVQVGILGNNVAMPNKITIDGYTFSGYGGALAGSPLSETDNVLEVIYVKAAFNRTDYRHIKKIIYRTSTNKISYSVKGSSSTDKMEETLAATWNGYNGGVGPISAEEMRDFANSFLRKDKTYNIGKMKFKRIVIQPLETGVKDTQLFSGGELVKDVNIYIDYSW